MLTYDVLVTECGVSIQYKGWKLCVTEETLAALAVAIARAHALLQEQKDERTAS